MRCQCEHCQYLRQFDVHIRDVKSKEAAEFFDEMLDRLVHAEMDRDVKQAVIDGSWHNADEVIAYARAKRANA